MTYPPRGVSCRAFFFTVLVRVVKVTCLPGLLPARAMVRNAKGHTGVFFDEKGGRQTP